MMNLKNGILDVNGFQLSRETKVTDFENVSCNEVNIQVSKRGNTYVKFLKPILSGGVEGYVEVNFYKNEVYPEIMIFPKIDANIADTVDIAKEKVTASKKWLQHIVAGIPTSSGKEHISYEYDWGYISSMTHESRDYGLVGGEIKVVYKES